MPTGLIRRLGGRYSTRRVIPLDLQGLYGKREIVRALSTGDPLTARTLHARMWVALDQEFAAARAGLSDQAPTRLAAKPRAANDPWSQTQSLALWEFDREQEALRDEASDLLETEQEEREETADRLEARLLDPDAVLSFEELATRDLLRHYAFKTTVAEDQAAIARAQTRSPATPRTTDEILLPAKGQTTLSQVLDRWAAESKANVRTVNRTRNIADRFEEAAGVTVASAITRKHVLDFKDHLVASGQSPANINVMIPMLGTVFNYAVANDLMAINPAAKIRVADNRRAKDKRRAFEAEEITAIFESPVFKLGYRPAAGGGEAAYWLPLLALYTGARQTEIGQLHPDDIVREGYVDGDQEQQFAWVIRLVENKARGQRVKNEGSERRIPIHADLVSLGFLEVALTARNEKRDRIFHEIVPNAQGELMGNWSKWFGRYRRKECGLAGKDTPFHAFRHTFKHLARLVGIPSDVHNAITGHETGDVADAYGAMSYPLRPLVEAIERYRVPGLALPARPPNFRDALG